MKKIAVIFLILAVGFIVWDILHHKEYIDAFSGATPPALERDVPDNLSVIVDGKVKHEYRFTEKSFRLLAKIRIRTREAAPDGKILGAYIYTGIPVLYIMEGVAPLKEKSDAFDRPMDMIVVFTGAGGKTVSFSYGELTTVTDSLPITLAFKREQVLPSKKMESYTKNKYTEPLNGIRLICPREQDNSRYLDNVTKITLTVPETPDSLLPKEQKGNKCISDSITCIENETTRPAVFEDVPLITVPRWFRTGHGRGIKGEKWSTVTGYHLRSFLRTNFPGTTPDHFFLFVGCDGYRTLFSGREIFETDAGDTFLMIKMMDNKPPKGGYTVAPVSDFFIDRSVWGVSHIVRL